MTGGALGVCAVWLLLPGMFRNRNMTHVSGEQRLVYTRRGRYALLNAPDPRRRQLSVAA
jgi:hypothetical protein